MRLNNNLVELASSGKPGDLVLLALEGDKFYAGFISLGYDGLDDSFRFFSSFPPPEQINPREQPRVLKLGERRLLETCSSESATVLGYKIVSSHARRAYGIH